MKRFRKALAFAPLAVFLSLASAQERDPDAITWIPQTTVQPFIDGQVDQIWHAQESFPITVLTNGSITDEQDFSAEWYGLYDDTFLYILIDIKDQVLESEAASAGWKNDRIETYFNMDNVKPGGNSHTGDNFQYNFRWNRPDDQSVNNNTWDGIEWAYTTTNDGYITEIRFPWANLTGPPPEFGFSFGFDIAIIDNDGFENYDSITYWWNSTGQAEYSNIDGAGTIGLGEVFDGNYAPVVQPLDIVTVFEEQSESIQLTASDANESDALTFSLADAPGFINLTDLGNGTTSIEIDAGAGTANIYEFTVLASDGSRTGSTHVILIVKDPAVLFQIPVFDPVPDAAVQQGNQLAIDITVTDIDSLETTISGLNLPAFVSIVKTGNKSATVEIQPGFDTPTGLYVISLLTEDADGQSTTVQFQLEVLEASDQAEFYCDPVNGDLLGDGTREAPWSGLQEVIEAGKLFKPGDIIFLMSGYHGEPVITGSNSGYVRITPAENANPTLSKLTFSENSAYWSVENLEISRSHAPVFSQDRMVDMLGNNIVLRNCSIFSARDSSLWSLADWRGMASRGIFVNGSNNLVDNCTFLNVSYGIHVVGTHNSVVNNRVQNFSADGMLGLGNDLLFENNYIADNYNVDDNHDDGFQSWSTGPGGPGTGVVYRNVLRGNTIIQTTDSTRPFQGGLQGIGCFGGMYDNWIIENNVVVVNHSHGITLYGGIECRIINNTVVDLDLDADPGPTWLHISVHKSYSSAQSEEEKAYYFGRDNVVLNNLVTALAVVPQFGTVEHNLVIGKADLDSVFVDYPKDLHLIPGSPAIDSGTNSGAPATDADGMERPADGDMDGSPFVDIGAYELALWRGLPVHFPSFADTRGHIGWIYTEYDPWLYLFNLSKWVYITPEWSGRQGGWTWIPQSSSQNTR